LGARAKVFVGVNRHAHLAVEDIASVDVVAPGDAE
jgi:hypothetical protein